MKIHAITKIAGFTILLLVLTACGSTTTASKWKDEQYTKKMSKTLVIGISEDEEMRRLFEDVMAQQLSKKGVKAVPLLDLLPASTDITKETVLPAIEGQGFDTAVVTHMVELKEVKRYVPVKRDMARSEDLYNNMYTYYRNTPVVQTKEVAVMEEVVVLETAVFDITTETRIWKMTSETLKPQKNKKTITDIAKVIVSNLNIDGML